MKCSREQLEVRWMGCGTSAVEVSVVGRKQAAINGRSLEPGTTATARVGDVLTLALDLPRLQYRVQARPLPPMRLFSPLPARACWAEVQPTVHSQPLPGQPLAPQFFVSSQPELQPHIQAQDLSGQLTSSSSTPLAKRVCLESVPYLEQLPTKLQKDNLTVPVLSGWRVYRNSVVVRQFGAATHPPHIAAFDFDGETTSQRRYR